MFNRIVLIGVLLCTPIFSFAGDAFAESMIKWHTEQTELKRNDPKFNEVAIITIQSKPTTIGTSPERVVAPVNNQFLDECESLTSNRQMCYELWVERQK